MVSKIVKRTPTKSLKSRKTRRKSSPPKSAAAVVVSSFNKSIYSCHRRLIKIFAKLTRITTPKKTPRKKGYQILAKTAANPPQNDVVVRRSLFNEKTTLLPPLKSPDTKTVFLDLDETLVHSTAQIRPEKYDFVVRPVIDGHKAEFYVLKRPFVDEFLEFLSERFEIVIFTAGIEEYASLVIDRLDWRNLISHRLYRDSCSEIDGKFVKDLSRIGRDLSKAVIVDDNPNSYLLQPENAIPIKAFVDDGGDDELKKMMEAFRGFDLGGDVRDAVRSFVADFKGGI